jgi:hypothetical protein
MKRILLAIFLVLTLAGHAWAYTDITYTLDSGGGDFTLGIYQWEVATDIDLTATEVMSGITVTDGSFPANGTTVDDGAGNSCDIVSVKTAGEQVLVNNITGTLTDTQYCDATDTDCFTCTAVDDTGVVWLEITGAWDEDQTYTGATTSANQHRGLKGDSNYDATCTGDCPRITDTAGNARTAYISENYFEIRNLCFSKTDDDATTRETVYFYADGGRFINSVVHDANNAGSGVTNGLKTYRNDDFLAFGSIFRGNEGYGAEISSGTDEEAAAICCTAIDNGTYGFQASEAGTQFVFSCYAQDNTTADFEEADFDAPSGFNASKDETSDLGGTAGLNYENTLDLNLDANGLAQDSTNMTGDDYGQNPYNDISVTAGYTFGGFLWDGATSDSTSESDILGDARPDPHVADSDWHVGADQYPTAGGNITSINGVPKANVSSYMGVPTANISTIDGVAW